MTGKVRTLLEKSAVRRAFDRRASGYLDSAQVQSEVCRRMLERMDLVKIDPRLILDAGSGPGVAAQALAQRYPKARVIALDLSLHMLRGIPKESRWSRWLATHRAGRIIPLCSDFERLPLSSDSLDCIVSNLALPWCSDLAALVSELHRTLKPGGLLMLTTVGPDTLREWVSSAKRAELAALLPDMHDLGDLLVRQGFSGPVMDQEHLRLTYSGVASLLRDAWAWGAVGMGPNRLRGLTGRGSIAPIRPTKEGAIEVTLEIVYGHAWKAAHAPPSRGLGDGRSIIRFDRALPKS